MTTTPKNETLDLVLKVVWWDMILSGEKKEEYRDINRLYNRRLFECCTTAPGKWGNCQEDKDGNIVDDKPYPCNCCRCDCSRPKKYKYIRFHRGYTSTVACFEIEDIRIGTGNPDWGAVEGKEYFVIKIGKRIY